MGTAQVSSPAITPARITVDSPVPTGRTTPLPSLAVRNEGNTELTYRMAAVPAAGDLGRAAAWIHLDPVEFALAPGAAREVTVAVAVPSGEPHEAHELMLQASVVAPADASGLNLAVAVAVASVLEFRVGDPPSGGFDFRLYGGAIVLAIVAGAVAYRLAALTEGAGGIEFQSPIRRKRRPPEVPPKAGDEP